MPTNKISDRTLKIVNSIRDNASDFYKSKVGEFNKDSNINELTTPLMEYDVVYNEFMTGLVNVIGETILNKIGKFDNPLKKFRTKTNGLGIDVREIASGLVSSEDFELTVEGIAKMFKLYPQEYAECFHRINRRVFYPLTISKKEFQLTSMTWDILDEFIEDKINTLYESNELDEYLLSIELIRSGINVDGVKTIVIDEVVDESTGKTLTKAIENCAKSFKYRNNTNSIWGNNHPTSKILPLAKVEDIAVIMPYTLVTDIKTDVLAVAFNKDEIGFNKDTLTEVEEVGFIKKTVEGVDKYYKIDAIVCDKNWLRIMDDPDNEVNGNDLPTARAYNRYLHIWSTYSTSPFKCVNAIAHEVEESEIPDGYFDNLATSSDDVVVGNDTHNS